MLGCLGILFRLERRILAMIFSYSLAIGLFSLIVPLPVAPLRTLLGRDRKTNLRFGDYAAVTVYSQKRVPAVLSQAAVLSDDLYELLDAANLDEATQEKSRNRGGSAGS